MAHPMGESKRDGLRVDFDRRLKLEFHGSKITSDGGLLAYRELDDALGLTEVAGTIFQDSRTGKNGWHGMTGQFRQSVFGRLGGYEDVNDADRLGRDPAMRWIVGGKAVERQAASTSQMGRFETELLATDANIEVLAGMNGAWIDKVHDRRPPKMIILDMDSSVSTRPMANKRERRTMVTSAAPATIPYSCSTSSAIWSNPLYRLRAGKQGMIQAATAGGIVQAVFPEGGLSRDGRLSEPKLGHTSRLHGLVAATNEHGELLDLIRLHHRSEHQLRPRAMEDRSLLRSRSIADVRSRVAWTFAVTMAC